MADDYATAWDALTTAIAAAKGRSSGFIDDVDHLTVDQRLKVAEIAALLSISQEISAFNPNNTYTLRDGKKIDAWGMEID